MRTRCASVSAAPCGSGFAALLGAVSHRVHRFSEGLWKGLQKITRWPPCTLTRPSPGLTHTTLVDATLDQLVSDFAGMARERHGHHLNTWIAAAQPSDIP